MPTVNTNRKFRDIDLSFRINPFTKDLYTKTDEEAVKTALKNLILTKNFERKFHPEIGTQVQSLLFENNSPAVLIAMDRTIRESIERFEPRVRIVDLQINETQDPNELLVYLVFSFKNVDNPITLTTTLTRVR
jgi:phage baseplate assembly protein W